MNDRHNLMYNTDGRNKGNYQNFSHKTSWKSNINMGGHRKTDLTETLLKSSQLNWIPR